MNQYITVPTLAAGVGIGKLSYDFDQGLGKVGSLVNKCGSEMKQYKDRIIELSNKSGVGLKQMTESMYQGISAGANLNNVFKLLDTSSKLSIGGFTSQETAIDGLTTAMNSFGISYDNVNNVSDKFILTQNLGKTTVDELASSIGQVAPTAHAAGVSFDELMSGVAALTKNGIATSESMTAMKAALSNIIKPSGEAQKIAKSLGLEFNTTALKSKGLAGFLEDVKQKTGGNIDTMGKLFGSTEALNAMLLLTGSGAKDFNGALSEMEKSAGLTDNAFKNMKESSGAKLLDSINKLKNSLIGLGDVLAPAIGFVADKISELSGWFGHLSDDGKIAVVAIAGIAAAIGPVLTGIGSLLTIGGNATIMFSALGVSASTVGAVLGGGFIAALALVVEKLGNSTSALQSLQDNFGTFGTAVGAVLEVLSGGIELTFGNMLIFLEQVGKGMLAFIKGDWGSIPNIVEETTAKLHANGAKALNNLTATTTRAIQILKQSTADGMKGVKDTFDLALKELPKLSKDNIGKISNEFSNGLSKLDADSITILKGTSESMNLLFNGIYEGMSKGEAKEKFKQNLTDMLQSGQFTTSELQNDIKQSMDTINHNIADGSSTIKQSGTDMFNAFKESAKFGVEGAASEVSSKLSGMNQETLNQLTSFGSTWKQAFDGIKLDGSMSSQQMKDKIIENIKGMGLTTEQLISQLRNESSQHWANMANDAQNVGNKAKVAFEQIPKEVVTTLKNNGLESKEQITTLYNSLMQLPPEVQTLIKANNYEALQGATSVQQVLQNLPPEKVIDIITKMSKDTNSDPKVIKQMIDSLPKEKRTKVMAEVGDAIKNIESVQNKKVDGKKVKVSEEGSSRVKNDLDKINRTKMTPKNTKVSESGSGVVNAILGRINNTQMKSKNTKVTENGASHVKSQLDSVNSRAKSKTVTITTVFKQVTQKITSFFTRGKGTDSGGIQKEGKVTKKVVKPLNVIPSQSPVPMSTGAPTSNTATPMATGGAVGGSPVPNGVTTGVSTNNQNVDIGYNSVYDSMKFDINLLEKLENRLSIVNNKVQTLDKQMNKAFGGDKIDLLNRQNELFKEQLDIQKQLESKYKSQQEILQSYLKQRGFVFSSDGNISNYETKLISLNKEYERLSNIAEDASNKASKFEGNESTKKILEGQAEAAKKRSDEYNRQLVTIKKYLDEYKKIVFADLPKAEQEFISLNNAIKDNREEIAKINYELKETYRKQLLDQLNTTSEIQKKITDVYKKNIEERKKLIDFETKYKIDSINKEKDTYNKSRKEIDYKNDIEEQRQAINQLQDELDNASRDTSIIGQKRVQQLSKQMDELNKKLQDTVQQELDRQVNESYDNEADRIKAQSDRFIEALESKFDDKNVANLVNQSLSSGIFTDIDGNVKNLKDTLNQFFLESNDSFSVLGATIQKELNNNLQIAFESMKNLKGIYKDLGVDFSSASRFGHQSNVTSTNNQNVTVQFNQPLVVANSVTKDSLPDLDNMIRQAEKRITENIVKFIR
nr:phage tail tape measure protein [[Eubacterium] tenue]